MQRKVRGNTHHLRLAPGAAIDILHLLIRCVRKKRVVFFYSPSKVNSTTQMSSGFGVQVHKSSRRRPLRLSCTYACVFLCVMKECVDVEVQRDAGKVWEVKLPNSSAAARELLTGQLGLIVCSGEQGG